MGSPHLAAETLPDSGPLLVNDKQVRPTEEEFRWPVPPEFTAERTRDGDRLERELLAARGHVAAASPFACDHSVVSHSWTQLGHKTCVVGAEFARTSRIKSNRISSLMVGERGFEPPTPWSRTERRSNPKCFNWCRLGAKTPNLLSPLTILFVPNRFCLFPLEIKGIVGASGRYRGSQGDLWALFRPPRILADTAPTGFAAIQP